MINPYKGKTENSTLIPLLIPRGILAESNISYITCALEAGDKVNMRVGANITYFHGYLVNADE